MGQDRVSFAQRNCLSFSLVIYPPLLQQGDRGSLRCHCPWQRDAVLLQGSMCLHPGGVEDRGSITVPLFPAYAAGTSALEQAVKRQQDPSPAPAPCLQLQCRASMPWHRPGWSCPRPWCPCWKEPLQQPCPLQGAELSGGAEPISPDLFSCGGSARGASIWGCS